MAKEKKRMKQPNWKFTIKRQDSLAHAREVKNILIAIGKEYRNKAIRKAKYRRLLG